METHVDVIQPSLGLKAGIVELKCPAGTVLLAKKTATDEVIQPLACAGEPHPERGGRDHAPLRRPAQVRRGLLQTATQFLKRPDGGSQGRAAPCPPLTY